VQEPGTVPSTFPLPTVHRRRWLTTDGATCRRHSGANALPLEKASVSGPGGFWGSTPVLSARVPFGARPPGSFSKCPPGRLEVRPSEDRRYAAGGAGGATAHLPYSPGGPVFL
jgi:hypothetical protein